MNVFYGVITELNEESLKASSDKGEFLDLSFLNIDKEHILNFRIGTEIKFFPSTGRAFYLKGKSKTWTFLKYAWHFKHNTTLNV